VQDRSENLIPAERRAAKTRSPENPDPLFSPSLSLSPTLCHLDDVSRLIGAPHFISLQIRSQGRGELLVSLCWQPAASRLTVVVLKARNLPKMDVTGLAGK